jgi:site-specific DNA-methyltransferase (cytosine-N4-specific)
VTLVNICHQGDVRELLPRLLENGLKAQCVVTSPPYWGLRDYGVEGQLGLEGTPDEYVANMAAVFDHVYRLLADDGVLWLNLGDCYCSSKNNRSKNANVGSKQETNRASNGVGSRHVQDLPPKSLVGIPWMVAFALRDHGWILRSACIWHKPNPMTESVKDRPTVAHEYVFLFSKGRRYFYDHQAVREPAVGDHPRNVDCPYQAPGQPVHQGLRKKSLARYSFKRKESVRGLPLVPGSNNGSHRPDRADVSYCDDTRNLRDVWTIPVQGCKGAHFATFPEDLAEICIKSGSREGDLVMDPFMGAGTVAVVAEKFGRSWLGVELNPDYIELQNQRLRQIDPLLKVVNL